MRYEPGGFIVKYFDELGSKAKESTSHNTQHESLAAGLDFTKKNLDYSYVVLRVINNSRIKNEKYYSRTHSMDSNLKHIDS